MGRPMGDDERRRFMGAGTRTGMLATSRRDGSPHVTPVWFVLDGDDVVFMTGAATLKGRNLRRDARASLAVDQPAPPYSFVRVDGEAELNDDLAAMLPWSIAIAARCMGPDRAGRRIVSEAGVAD